MVAVFPAAKLSAPEFPVAQLSAPAFSAPELSVLKFPTSKRAFPEFLEHALTDCSSSELSEFSLPELSVPENSLPELPERSLVFFASCVRVFFAYSA